jgi:Bacterial Ig-like domain (group 2)
MFSAWETRTMSVCRRLLEISFLILSVVFIPACGHDQQLVSITVEPATETFGAANIPVDLDAGLSVHLRALGTFIHPPVTKDITAQVTWTSNTPQMVTVDATGLLMATGMACGNALVSATVNTNKSAGNISSSGAIVTGTMTANVVCFTGP